MTALLALLRMAAGLAVLAGIVTLFNVGVPYALLQVGLGNGYDAGVFRWGMANYSKSFDVTGQASTRVVGIAFGRRGEAVRIEWNGTIDSGEPTLALDEFLGGGTDPIWRTRLNDRAFGSVEVPIQSTGLVQIRFSRTRWSGDVRIRWRLVPDASRAAPPEGGASSPSSPAPDPGPAREAPFARNVSSRRVVRGRHWRATPTRTRSVIPANPESSSPRILICHPREP